MKKIISLTTLPDRIMHIKPCIDSLLIQENIDFIEMNIPYISKRFNKTYEIPEWLTETEKIKIFRTEDYGPLTKAYPTLIRYKENPCIIILVDDDCIYSKGYFQILINEYSKRENTIICGNGCIFKTRGIRIASDEVCDLVQGFSGVVLPSNILTKKIENYIQFALSNDDGYLSDDIIISNIFSLLNFKIFSISLSILNSNIRLIQFNEQLKNNNNNIIRYVRFLNWMYTNGNYWFKKEVPSYMSMTSSF